MGTSNEKEAEGKNGSEKKRTGQIIREIVNIRTFQKGQRGPTRDRGGLSSVQEEAINNQKSHVDACRATRKG